MIALLGDRWYPHTAKQGRGKDEHFFIIDGENVVSAQMLEVSLRVLGVGTMLCPEKDAWSTAKRLIQENKGVRSPPPTLPLYGTITCESEAVQFGCL